MANVRIWECPLLCRFLDAGNDETLLALRRPASKKRRGTKSREVGHRLSRERYGDLILTPAVMVGTMLAQCDRDGYAFRACPFLGGAPMRRSE